MIQFKDLPVEIQERMLDEQVRQGNPQNAEVFEEEIVAGVGEGGFNWGQSVEGGVFWHEIVCNGNSAIFYKKYPQRPPIEN